MPIATFIIGSWLVPKNDPDMREAEKAIHRAAIKARERALRFGHGIIIYENGKIVEKHPDKND
jgi:hypothetical protein